MVKQSSSPRPVNVYTPGFDRRQELRNKLLKDTETFLSHMLIYEQQFKPRKKGYFEKVTRSFFESCSRWGLLRKRVPRKPHD